MFTLEGKGTHVKKKQNQKKQNEKNSVNAEFGWNVKKQSEKNENY